MSEAKKLFDKVVELNSLPKDELAAHNKELAGKLIEEKDGISLDEYKQQLRRHDWYYDFSDDGRVWGAGYNERLRLKGIAETNNDEFKRAFNEEYTKHFNPEKGFSTATPPFEV